MAIHPPAEVRGFLVMISLKTKNGGQAFVTFDGGRDDIENFPNLFKEYLQQYKEEL